MTIILIRHAEKKTPTADALSAAGTKRAKFLARMFKETGVTAIFTSQFTRTRQTAAPLATATGVTPRVIATDPATARSQVLAAGACPFVIGHSDTVPDLIEALGGATDIAIDEQEFDRMFIVTILNGKVATVEFRYGTA